MPELPEVETVRRGLEPVLLGQTIRAATINRPDLRWPLPPDMAGRLRGQRVTALRRRSKYILADLSGGESLLIHLGMSGRILISGSVPGLFHHTVQPAGKHDHVVLDIDTGATVTFNDARRFGMMDLMPTEGADLHPLLARLGPEPLGNVFSAGWLQARFARRVVPVKVALLDQATVAGLRNIYVSEALFRAGIAPWRKVGSLTVPRLDRLVTAIRAVLEEALLAGGSTLRDHRQVNGELGYFQHSFRVYDRTGQPCTQCGSAIARIMQGGRSSFYCPACQR